MAQVLYIDWPDGQTMHVLPRRVKKINVGQEIMVAGSPFECWYVEELSNGDRNIRAEPKVTSYETFNSADDDKYDLGDMR